jgi:RecA/RadA recombinase
MDNVDKGLKKAEKLDTGSRSFNTLLGGGLGTCAITDVYGAAATGKTQFAFQNALTCTLRNSESKEPSVVFVDCAGSFRPERIAEMAEARQVSNRSQVLDRITSICVRSVSEQHEASERILNSGMFRQCKLLIVDDITTNFGVEYAGEIDKQEEVFVSRYYQLATYVRKLAYIALSRSMAVLLTNSVRSRFAGGDRKIDQREVETMGEIISEFALFRLHFTKRGMTRQAKMVQPFVRIDTANFNIETVGIVP